MATKTNYHHGDLRSELLRLGMEELEKSPHENLSLRDLAQRAGVSKTAPYRHFPDKNALLGALTAEGYRMLTKEMDEVLLANPEPQRVLEELGRAYQGFARKHPRLFYMMFSSFGLSLQSEECSVEGRRSFEKLVEAVRYSLAGAELDEDRFMGLVWANWAFVHGLSALEQEGFLPANLWDSPVGKDLLTRHPKVGAT